MTGSGAKATPGGGMKALLERIHLAMASWGRGNTRWPGDLPGAKKRFFGKLNLWKRRYAHRFFFRNLKLKLINDASSMMLHQWCVMMFLYFPIKKKTCYKLVGRRTRFALGVVWESMHLSDGTLAKSRSTRWNWSPIKMANWMANMNVEIMGCSCFP